VNIHLALQRGVRHVNLDRDPIENQGHTSNDSLKKLPLLLPNDGEFAAGVIAEGFDDPESEGRWTLGTSAQVTFNIWPSQWPNGLLVQVLGRPMEVAGQRARVSVRINKADPVRLDFSKKGWTSFSIPVGLESGGKQTILCQWIIDNPLSPFSYGASDDDRQLGMLVGKLELRPASRTGNWPFLANWGRLFQRFVGQR
jgi:hypothetical protein